MKLFETGCSLDHKTSKISFQYEPLEMKNLHENTKEENQNYFRQLHPLDRNKDVFMYDIEVGYDTQMKTLNTDTHQFQRIFPLEPL